MASVPSQDTSCGGCCLCVHCTQGLCCSQSCRHLHGFGDHRWEPPPGTLFPPLGQGHCCHSASLSLQGVGVKLSKSPRQHSEHGSKTLPKKWLLQYLATQFLSPFLILDWVCSQEALQLHMDRQTPLTILSHLIGGLHGCVRDCRTLKASCQRNGHPGEGAKGAKNQSCPFPLQFRVSPCSAFTLFDRLSPPDAYYCMSLYV